jgi:sugar lactone lactonase YvrE
LGATLLPGQERIYSFSTLAGTASAGHVDGAGETARFNRPTDVAVDQAGNLYVADSGNYSVRKITPAGVTSTVAGAPFETRAIDGPLAVAGFRAATAIKVDPIGNLYVADSVAVRRIGIDGLVSTFAGYEGEGYPPPLKADGTGTQARFNGISGLGLGPGGTLYVSDGDNFIRQITPSAVVTTLAGGRGQGDGQGTAAGFLVPVGIHVDAGGIIWIADSGNHTIRRMTPDGTVTTFAGQAGVQGDTDGIGQAASFYYPQGVTGDLAGNLYVAEFGSQGIRKIDPWGVTTFMAGKAGPDITGRQGSDDGDGRQAAFSHPLGLATDRAGNVYIADEHNNLIRKMTPSGSVSTVAGFSREEAAGHHDARGGEARFRSPGAIAVTTAGIAYVADTGNHVIRKIDLDGTVSTFAGGPGEPGYVNGTGGEARFDGPHALALGKDGNLHVADASNAVRRITPDGVVTTLAGSNQPARTIINAAGPAASFSQAGALAVAADGSVWVTDRYHTSYGATRTALRKITATGQVTTERGEFWPHTGITGMAFAPDGTLYLADPEYHHVFKFKTGATDEILPLRVPGGGFSAHGIAIGQEGNIFLTESRERWATRVAQMSADGEVRILGGVLHAGWKDGVGAKTVFSETAGIAVDGKGSLYIACSSHVIRKGVVVGAPVITTQPQGAAVAAGGSVQFVVTATGEPAPSYQWFRNNTAIGGATAASLAFSNVQAGDAGNYTVTVSNSAGSVTSATATLTVSATGNPGPVPTPGPGSGSGGGGAASPWFLAALLVLNGIRWVRSRAQR